MDFEEANKGYKNRTKSDFHLIVDIESRHICFTCTHREDCYPAKVNHPVAECNHYEGRKKNDER